MLNLWQKNGVFKIEIIQPLLDMAAGTSNAAPVAENVTNNEGTVRCYLSVSLDNGIIHERFYIFSILVDFFCNKGSLHLRKYNFSSRNSCF